MSRLLNPVDRRLRYLVRQGYTFPVLDDVVDATLFALGREDAAEAVDAHLQVALRGDDNEAWFIEQVIKELGNARSPGWEKIIPWYAREMKRLHPHDHDDHDERASAWRVRMQATRAAPALAQWYLDERPDLNRISLLEALDAIGVQAERLSSLQGYPGRPVFEFEDGWSVVDVPLEGLRLEGEIMQNCIRHGHYDDDVADGSTNILSLRDKQDRPHVDFELNRQTHEFEQIVGKQNRAPSDKYAPYIVAFLRAFGFQVATSEYVDEIAALVDEGCEAFQGMDWQETSYVDLRVGGGSALLEFSFSGRDLEDGGRRLALQVLGDVMGWIQNYQDTWLDSPHQQPLLVDGDSGLRLDISRWVSGHRDGRMPYPLFYLDELVEAQGNYFGLVEKDADAIFTRASAVLDELDEPSAPDDEHAFLDALDAASADPRITSAIDELEDLYGVSSIDLERAYLGKGGVQRDLIASALDAQYGTITRLMDSAYAAVGMALERAEKAKESAYEACSSARSALLYLRSNDRDLARDAMVFAEQEQGAYTGVVSAYDQAADRIDEEQYVFGSLDDDELPTGRFVGEL